MKDTVHRAVNVGHGLHYNTCKKNKYIWGEYRNYIEICPTQKSAIKLVDTSI